MREIIRSCCRQGLTIIFPRTNTQQIEQWFNLGGTIKIDDDQSALSLFAVLEQIQGLFEKLSALWWKQIKGTREVVSAAEFCWKECTPTRN